MCAEDWIGAHRGPYQKNSTGATGWCSESTLPVAAGHATRHADRDGLDDATGWRRPPGTGKIEVDLKNLTPTCAAPGATRIVTRGSRRGRAVRVRARVRAPAPLRMARSRTSSG